MYIDVSDNNGRGYFVFDENGNRIDLPQLIALYHELCTGHVTEGIQGAIDPADTDTKVIECENAFRAAQNPPYTKRKGHGGGAVPAGTGRYPR